ncbi:hypothetical protein ACHAPQ_005201 [Fusarium lateritium]
MALIRVLCTHVGLAGNIEDGSNVQSDVLFETSGKVKRVLGIDLVLAIQLRDMRYAVTAGIQPNENFPEEKAIRKDGHTDGALDEAESDDTEQDCVYDNVTMDYSSAIASDVGVQAWTEAAKISWSRARPRVNRVVKAGRRLD